MEIGERVRARIRDVMPTRTQASIAAQVGMTPDAFSRALSGSRGFSAGELATLSELLETSMYWLATGEPDPSEAVVLARHDFDQVTRDRRADWDSLLAVAERVTLAYRQAGSHSPSADVPVDAAETRVALGDDFVGCFAERLHDVFAIDVVRVGGIQNACSIRIRSREVVILNETGNWFHQNWSLAHELGHIALGHRDSAAGVAHPAHESESAANGYAAELLLPREILVAIDWTRIDGEGIAARLWAWGISSGALLRRLRVLRLDMAPAVESVLEWSTQRILRRYPGWNPDGTDLITRRMEAAAARRFPSALHAAHLDLVSQGRLPKGTLAWMLGVDETEIEVDPPDAGGGDIDELAHALGLAPR